MATRPRPASPDSGNPADPPLARPPFSVAGKRLHLVGVGGCGMSGLARMLRDRGGLITGADMQESAVTRALQSEGFSIEVDPAAAPRTPETAPGAAGAGPSLAGVDLVVISAAVKPDHPAVAAAQARGIPVLTYAETLGRCMLGRTGVAVAGTHGKSTTAAMLGAALIHAGLDPTVIVGATSPHLALPGQTGSAGFRLGASRVPAGPRAGAPGVLVAEACEFNRSFHNLHPTIASISAVEADHLDIYGSLDAVVEAFAAFARKIPDAKDGGMLLIGHDGAHRREVTAGARCAVETVGFSPAADWHVTIDRQTRAVALRRRDRSVAYWTMQMPGEHNALNSAFAAAMALTLGADPALVAEGLGAFRGVDRRLQFLGEREGVRVYDDYGHHPTEVDATLRAIREHERPEDRGGRLVCVFQPHQHSRTRFLLDEFAASFSHADAVIVPHIYFVRDSEIEKTKVSAADLVDRLRARSVSAMHLYPFDAIVEHLRVVCRPGDVLVVMGAGPVWKVAHGFLGIAEA